MLDYRHEDVNANCLVCNFSRLRLGSVKCKLNKNMRADSCDRFVLVGESDSIMFGPLDRSSLNHLIGPIKAHICDKKVSSCTYTTHRDVRLCPIRAVFKRYGEECPAEDRYQEWKVDDVCGTCRYYLIGDVVVGLDEVCVRRVKYNDKICERYERAKRYL